MGRTCPCEIGIFLPVFLIACSGASPRHAVPPSPGQASALVGADWLEPVSEPRDSRSGFPLPAEVAALGTHLTLVRTGVTAPPTFVGIHDERGVVGFFTRTDARWVGLDEDDSIYLVDFNGELSRAATLDDAALGKWEPRTAIPDAKWTSSARILAAVLGDVIRVSTDTGLTFREFRPARGGITFAGARADGVLVVQAAGPAPGALETLVSEDQGEHFSVASVTLPQLEQVGSWIYSRCGRVVLSRDPKKWIRVDTLDELALKKLPHEIDASETFEAGAMPERVSLIEPPLPEPTSINVVSGVVSCAGHWTVAPRVRVDVSPAPAQCVGVDCIFERLRTSAYPARTRVLLLHDGLCEGRHADAEGRCAPDAPLIRSPHALLLEGANPVRVLNLPNACRPASVRSGGGLALLLCRDPDGAATIYTTDRNGAWFREGSFRVPEDAASTPLQVAKDGTVLFEGTNGKHAVAAWVRAPVPLGHGDAWRELRHSGVRAYSVTNAGGALAVVSEPPSFPDRFSLLLDGPRSSTVLMPDSGSLGSLRLFDACRRDDHILLLFRTERSFRIETVKDGRRVTSPELRGNVDESWLKTFLDDLGLCKGPL